MSMTKCKYKRMNVLLFTIWLTSVLSCVAAAPAVSSVHVTFVSGNKATHYSHGTGDDGSVSQLNLQQLDEGTSRGDHAVRKRSVTRRPPSDPGGIELLKVTNRRPTSQSVPTTTTEPLPHVHSISTTTDNTIQRDAMTETKSTLRPKPATRRVAFLKADSDETLNDKESKLPLKPSKHSKDERPQEELTASAPATAVKPKDTKAVKRSPQFHDNFLGSFDFPDFDEFGGNDFGHPDREFEESPHDREPHHHHNNEPSHHSNGVESLAPDGVFLPPVPTQASNYVESDPYLAQPEVANYAVQHVPYFHEFPHKRTVLALNERREENGLEPNVLRSIRPFFAFFEINKRR